MNYKKPLSAFSGYGMEFEYMIVDRETLRTRPICDRVFSDVGASGLSAFYSQGIGWSNELAMHIIEFKNPHPVEDVSLLAEKIHVQVKAVNDLLAAHNACLLPTAMHPFMNPRYESRLWPYDNNEIYSLYNRIFNCHAHGWVNVQSVHLNLSFANDDEFRRLHTAIRLILPYIPGLCASSPFSEGAFRGLLDFRLEQYRNNQKLVPLITGAVIPEVVLSPQEYKKKILRPMYKQIAPYDPEGILQHEWLNSRGVIARFSRSALEIRLMDIQENPFVDVAIAELVIAVVKALYNEEWSSFREQVQVRTDELEGDLLRTIITAGKTIISNRQILGLFGCKSHPVTVISLWEQLAERVLGRDHAVYSRLLPIFKAGTLAERILESASELPEQGDLVATYERLHQCLAGAEHFE